MAIEGRRSPAHAEPAGRAKGPRVFGRGEAMGLAILITRSTLLLVFLLKTTYVTPYYIKRRLT